MTKKVHLVILPLLFTVLALSLASRVPPAHAIPPSATSCFTNPTDYSSVCPVSTIHSQAFSGSPAAGYVSTEAKFDQQRGYFDGGTTGYGGQNPDLWIVLESGLSSGIRSGPPNPQYNFHNFEIDVTIKDSSGNIFPLGPSTLASTDVWETPYQTNLIPDYAGLLSDTISYMQGLLGLDLPPTLKFSNPIQNGYTFSSNTLIAHWTNYPNFCTIGLTNNCGNVVSPQFDKALRIRLVPTFATPDVYSISISTKVEMGLCNQATVIDRDTGSQVYAGITCATIDTVSLPAYSFNYVYENDPSDGGDAADSLLKDGGTPGTVGHGSFSGFLYGIDTADVYLFQASFQNERISFSVTPRPNEEVSLSIYDTSQNWIQTQDAGRGATSGVAFTATSSSTCCYSAKVSLVGSPGGSYTFRLSGSFAMSGSPSSVDLGLVGTGSTATSSLTLSSPTDFSGQVTLSTSVTPAVANAPTVSISTVTATATAVFSPTSVVSTQNCPVNPSYAFASDSVYADFYPFNSCGLSQTLAKYGYSPTLPAGASITSVKVLVKHFEDYSNCSGCRPASSVYIGYPCVADPTYGCTSSFLNRSSDTTETIDITSAQTSWTSSNLASLQIMFIANLGYSTAHLDWLPLQVTYTYPTTTSTLSAGGSDSRVVTISDSSSTPAGAYTVSITGTSQGISFTIPITATVQDFQVSVSPSFLTVPPGTSRTTTVTVSSFNGFTGTVSLAISAPGGITTGFSTNVITGGSGTSTLTISVTTQPSPDPATVTIIASSGGQTRNAILSVLNPPPTIALSTTPYPGVTTSGSSVQLTETVKGLYGFAGTVSLTNKSPPGLTCSSPNPSSVSLTSTVTSATSTFSCSAPAGVYTVNATGTSGSTSAFTYAPLNFQDFTITTNPTSATVLAGTTASSTITISPLYGYTGTVSLSVVVSPSGLTCSLSQTSISGSSGTSPLSCSGTGGTYQVTVTATSGSLSHSTTFTVYVQDFGLSANPTSLSMVAGVNGGSTISLNPQFIGTVTLGASVSPSTGLYCSFNPTSITGSGTSTMNCNGSIAGSYIVTVTGTYGTTSHTTQVTYNIRDFILTVTPTAISIPDGRSATLTVQATSMNGYTGTITLGETYTACATWSFAKPTLTLASGGSDSTILTLTMGPNCFATQYNTAVTGYDSVAGFSRSASLVVNVTDFGIYSQIGSSTVGIGGQYTLKYNVTYSNNNNYPGSILTQTVSWGPNNCCFSTTVPTSFMSSKPDVNSAAGVVSNMNVQAQSFSFPWNGQGFYAQGRDWLFFIYYGTCSGTTTNCLYYATSTNGATWSIYNTGLVTGSMPSVVTNGTAVFYVRYDGTDGQSGKALKLGIGVLHTDGTIAWQTEKTVKAATSGIFWYASSMRISTTGQIFVAYNRVTSAYGSGLPYVIHSNGLDYTTWQQETLLINSNDDWRFSLVPLPNGQMYILYWPFWGGLNGRAWSSGSWGNQETVTPNNTYVQQTAFGFSTGNSTVYAIWQERTSQKIQFAIRNNSWGTPQTIFTADTNSNPRWSISYDSLHRTWYILYYSYATNQIWEYSGEPGAWSGRTVLYSTIGSTSSMYIGSFYKSGQVNTSSNTLGIFWTQTDASSNLQLKYANATIYTGGSFSVTWPITSTGSGSGATSLMITASDGTITRSLTIQLVVNGYNVTYFYNPLTVTQGSSSGIYLQIFSEYNIPLTSATIVPVTVPSCLTVSPPNPQYFNIGPIGGYDFPLLPIAASSSCALGNYQVTVAISGVSVHTYDKQLTFTVTVVAPPPGGGGGGGSVAAGTLITLADGSQVPVQGLQVGMKLLSYDMATHQYVVTTITKFVTVECYNQMIISTGTGKPLIVDQNPAQKLYVRLPDGTVTLMGVTDLKVGYLLFDALSQTWVPITSIHYQNGGQHLMFDIYTDGPGNYIANGYLDPLKT